MSARHPYARPDYVAALATRGERAQPVEAWGTSILSRPIAAAGHDAAGPYPMTAFTPDARIADGLDELREGGAISVVLVADPLASPPDIAANFDLARPFKTHHLVRPQAYAPSKHHRAEIRRSQAQCTVERVALHDVLPTWIGLYDGLVEKHAIRGVSAFTPDYFEQLARMPELVALSASVEGRIVAMGLWFAHAGVGYNHLGASSAAGYAVGASYALYDAAIAHLADCTVINLGGGAGLGDDPDDGLARFKRGFANDAVPAQLFGKVLDPARYGALSAGIETSFFPAYRAPSAGVQSLRTASATLAMSAAS